jgi:hypothetical protein
MTPEARDDRRRARIALLVSFSSFFVFPAIPLGQTFGLAIPYLLAASVVAIGWRGSSSEGSRSRG